MAQGIGVRQTNYLVDTQLILKAAGAAQTASANGSLILDLGGSGQDFTPMVHFSMMVDVSAIDVTTGDESYRLILEGSDSDTFASAIEPLCEVSLGGAGAGLPANGDVASDTGRYVVKGCNLRNEHTYRYARLTWVIAGTTPSITFVAGLTMAMY